LLSFVILFDKLQYITHLHIRGKSQMLNCESTRQRFPVHNILNGHPSQFIILRDGFVNRLYMPLKLI